MIEVKRPTFKLTPVGFKYSKLYFGEIYQEFYCEDLKQTFYYANETYYQEEAV